MTQTQTPKSTSTQTPPPLSQTKNIIELEDFVFFIRKIWFGVHEEYGEYAIVDSYGIGIREGKILNLAGYYRTFSKNIVEKLKKVKADVENGKVVKAGVFAEKIYENARRTKYHWAFHLKIFDVMTPEEAEKYLEEKKKEYEDMARPRKLVVKDGYFKLEKA